MLVRQSLNVLLLDESALGGLLEQALGRGEVVQMNGFVQFNVLSLVNGLPDCGARAVFDAVACDLCYRQYEL